MMDELEFDAWLEQGGAQSAKGRKSRIYALRTIEKNLDKLGMQYRELDAAWEADRFEALSKRLVELLEEAERGGQEYRVLMPHSENPMNRLSRWERYLGQYGRFLAGESPRLAQNADRGEINQAALEEMRDQFLTHCPDFQSFVEPGTGWAQREKAYKEDAIKRVNSALAEDETDEILGEKVIEIMETAGKDSPFVRWQTKNTIKKDTPNLFPEFCAIFGRLVRTRDSTGAALATAYSALEDIRDRGAKKLTFGERINFVYSALAMVRSNEVAPLKIIMINNTWKALFGEKLFVEANADMAVDYRRFADGFDQLLAIMRSEWDWKPQDWLDIQGFIWIANDKSVTPVPSGDGEDIEIESQKEKLIMTTNRILYGPPGTGKTYTTAEEAVRLCGENVSKDHGVLTAVYNKLLEEGRIEFVTFHQSLSYEEFIEGLRPETQGAKDQGKRGNVGFRLKVEDGIFKRICDRARLRQLVRTRKIFQMPLSYEKEEVKKEEQILDALEAGEIRHESGGQINLSDSRFDDRQKTKDKLERQREPVSDRDLDIDFATRFRSDMQKGDYVVVSVGRRKIRAFGEITGDYFFVSDADYHPHRRKIEWLWRDDRKPVDFFQNPKKQFNNHVVCKVNGDEINWDRLEKIVLDRACPYVLIIDEINRANISKVFGELITLLEPDKRLGAENEIRLRLPYSKQLFGVPANLHVIGTMNTADRSIALLDTALRRRFTFREMMPDAEVLEEVGKIDLRKLLDTINERIEYLYDREHQIGHAYFMSCGSREDVDRVMRHKVIPLLAEYFFEDWSKIAAVLGDLESGEGDISGGFLIRTKLNAPPGSEDGDASPRYRWEVRSETDGFDYGKLVGT